MSAQVASFRNGCKETGVKFGRFAAATLAVVLSLQYGSYGVLQPQAADAASLSQAAIDAGRFAPPLPRPSTPHLPKIPTRAELGALQPKFGPAGRPIAPIKVSFHDALHAPVDPHAFFANRSSITPPKNSHHSGVLSNHSVHPTAVATPLPCVAVKPYRPFSILPNGRKIAVVTRLCSATSTSALRQSTAGSVRKAGSPVVIRSIAASNRPSVQQPRVTSGMTTQAHRRAQGIQTGYGAIVLADSPTGYYRLGDTSNTAIDQTANSWNGTYNGTLQRQTTGLIQGDAQDSTTFPGSGDVNVPRNARFETASASLEAWVEFSDVGSYQVLATYGDSDDYPYDSMALQYRFGDTNNPIAFQFAAGNTYNIVEPTSGLGTNPVVGQIYHVVGTYDGSTANLYVNGTLVGSSALPGTIDYPSTSNGLTIGAASDLGASADGALQEIAYYPVALSAAQVANHYNTGASVAPLYESDYPSDPTKVTPGPAVSTGLTVQGWIRSSSPQTNYPAFISYGTDNGPNYETYVLQANDVNGSSPADFYFNTSNGAYQVFGATNLVAGQTYFLAATYDGSTATLYVNGVAEGTESASGTILPYDGSNGLALFSKFNNSNPWSGQLWGVKIFGYARSQSQVSADYSAAPGPTPPPAPTPTPTQTPTAPPTSTPTPTPTPTAAPSSNPCALPAPPGTPIVAMTTPTTGINPWWSFVAGSLPGVGQYQVNVANQNLLLQSTDMNIPNAGVDLSMVRTYNSLSQHNAAGSDNATPSELGNQWTSTFDAHIAENSAGGLTVFDGDGARYDYTCDGSGHWDPPAGVHSTLVTYDGGSYFWTLPDGTTFTFWAPYYPQSQAGLDGRINSIIGRNENTYVNFAYSFDNGDASAYGNLSSVSLTTQSGATAVMHFATFGSYRLLSSLVFPDGTTTVNYSYDSSGNLVSVTKPGNDYAPSRTEAYTYPSGALAVESPRYTATNGSDGAVFIFGLTTAMQVDGVLGDGVMTFTPNDGTNTPLRTDVATPNSEYTGFQILTENTNENAFVDVDGHQTEYYFDQDGRVQAEAAYTGSQWLTTTSSWDAQNNLLAVVDPRGNVSGANSSAFQTSYAYDSAGNNIAVAEPQTTTAQGTIFPTQLRSYDAYHNVIASCDQVETNSLGANYPANFSSGSDSLCPSAAGTSRYSYTYSAAEPFGELTTIQRPGGYHVALSYNATAQGGVDLGLPTTAQGDVIQQLDGTNRQSTEQSTYDNSGDMLSYSKGLGTYNFAYDSLHRKTSASDPDNTTYTTTTYVTYNADSSISQTQTASQHAAGTGTTFNYDLDQNEVGETHHYGCTTTSSCTSAKTTKWYDGADRLVEVALPLGSGDYFGYPWLTRYLYGVAASNPGPSFRGGTTIQPYGNLYKTQEYIGADPASDNGAWVSTGWTDIKATSYDALNRPVTEYSVTPAYSSSTVTASQATNTYDGNGQLGFLSATQNPVGDTDTLTYDARGATSSETFSGSLTPSRGYTYDADGRVSNISSSVFGNDTRAYDPDGNLSSRAEPTSGGVSDPATLQYAYYPDDLKASLSASAEPGTGTSFTGITKKYNYRTDGLLSSSTFGYGGGSYPFAYTYTSAGRPQAASDPYATNAYQEAYDGYGRIQTYQRPNYSVTNIGYDLEDENAGFTSNVNTPDPLTGQTSVSVTNSYSVRGELIGESFGAGDTCYGFSDALPGGGFSPPAWHQSASANGFLLPVNTCPGDQFPTTRFDHNLGAMTFHGVVAQAQSVTNGTQYAYDSAGRVSGTTYLNEVTRGTVTTICNGSDTPAYDAESHIVSYTGIRAIPNNGGPPWCSGNTYAFGSYGWGPNGHIITVGHSSGSSPQSTSGLSYHTLHWDGDSLLFESTADGSVPAVFMDGHAGISNVSGSPQAYVNDYDLAGALRDQRTSSTPHAVVFSDYISGYLYAYPIGMTPYPNAIPLATAQDTSVVAYSSASAATDGFITVNGVRNYDQTATHWTSPDSVRGTSDDPMSEQPYVFNRNNPYSYSDPLGLDPCTTSQDGANNPNGECGTAVPAPPNPSQTPPAIIGRDPAAPPNVDTGDPSLVIAGRRGNFSQWVEEAGRLWDMANRKGLYGIGEGTAEDAKRLGEAWVGRGAVPTSDGKGMKSSDGMRVYRPPTFKPQLNKMQANYQQNYVNAAGRTVELSNGHMDIPILK